MDDIIIDHQVMRDARLMLERAARKMEALEHWYFASELDEKRYATRLSEVVANIEAVLARLK